MKKLIIILLGLVNCSNAIVTIKLAILDNLQSQKLSSENYVQDYLNGIVVAQYVAKQRGINLEFKYIVYSKDSLDILNKIPVVKSYNPDILIGPRFSDKFILLKKYFTDILVVSPLANSKEVYELPNNFYTMTLPNYYSATAISTFIAKHFSTPKHIFLFTTVDCISCFETSNYLMSYYHNSRLNTKIINYNFIANDVEKIDVSKILNSYEAGDIILTPNISYQSAVIIDKSVNYLARDNVTFIGSDGWGPAEVSYVGKIQSAHKFSAYRVIPWSINEQSEYNQSFKKNYFTIFKKYPSSLISFITFKTVMQILNNYVDPKQLNQRESILKNFQQLNNNLRDDNYSIYQVKSNKEDIIDTINVKEKGNKI